MSISQREFNTLLSRVEALESEIRAMRDYISRMDDRIFPLKPIGSKRDLPEFSAKDVCFDLKTGKNVRGD